MAVLKLAVILLMTWFGIVKAIPTISITGSKFFDSDGKQFYIKGVAYQLTEDDPLANTAQCQLDAALMKQLGANSIRVYHVDGTADHSGCMNAFAAAGIYIWVDLDSFKTYISLDGRPSWTQDKLDSFQEIMDNFQQYDNTAGFFVGNEVLNVIQDADAAPYLLTATASLRAYGQSKGYRSIPIGYSATDTGALPMLQDYLVCRSNVSERLDFYALNSYRWCGQSSFTESGYDTILAATMNYPVPIFFSEVGCITVPPRTFDDQAAVFGQMANYWSGSIIYEWIQELNGYGLIQYGPPTDTSVDQGSSIVQGFTRQGTPTPIAPDFTNLQNQWATLNPTGVGLSAYAATEKTTAPVCPSSTAGTSAWTVDPSAPLPTIGQAVISGTTSSGPARTIPSGSITVQSSQSSVSSTEIGSSSSQTPISSTTDLPSSGQSSSSTTSSASGSSSAASGSATSHSSSARTASVPVVLDSFTVLRTMIALAGICLGAMVWL